MPEASTPDKKYDVAISFLVQDLALAQNLRDRFAESLEVFSFTLSGATAAILVQWHHRYTNTLDGSGLYVAEFDQHLHMPSEMIGRRYLEEPRPVRKQKLMPTLSRSREYGWKGLGEEFLSSSRVAELVIFMLYDRMTELGRMTHT